MRNHFKPFILFSPDDAAGGGASGTEDPAPAGKVALETVTQPDYKGLAAEWQNRSTGWQNKYQVEQEERKAAEKKFLELQTQHTKVTGEHVTLADQLKTLQEKETLATAELGNTNTRLERLNMITSEFPSRIPFLKDNLLPDATGDELRAKLTAFVE